MEPTNEKKTETLTTTQSSSVNANRYLAFSLGTEEYAIPLLSVKEVIAFPEVTSVPYTPSHFLGIMNLRGQVISVIDLRLKFNIKTQNTSETAVIICDLSPMSIGIVVNSVNSVLSLSSEQIKPNPEVANSKTSEYVTGVTNRDKNLVLILDIAKTLDVADMAALKATNAKKAA